MAHGIRHLVKRQRRARRTAQFSSITRLILEQLAELGETTLSAFFPAKYPEARLWRELLGLDARYRFKRETFSVLLSRLKAQGLVVRSGQENRPGRWRLADRGRDYLRRQEDRRVVRPDGIRRLVIFDIPERERKKRDVIRYELAAAGYSQLQKSVWCGEKPLPAEFLELIDALALRRHVHIFSVRERGTLGS